MFVTNGATNVNTDEVVEYVRLHLSKGHPKSAAVVTVTKGAGGHIVIVNPDMQVNVESTDLTGPSMDCDSTLLDNLLAAGRTNQHHHV